MNKQRSLLKWSITGTVVVTLCCFTPILVILFTAIGLSGLIGYLDYVLLPSLVFFVGLTAYALFKNEKKSESNCD